MDNARLELVQRLVNEGKSREEIRAALGALLTQPAPPVPEPVGPVVAAIPSAPPTTLPAAPLLVSQPVADAVVTAAPQVPPAAAPPAAAPPLQAPPPASARPSLLPGRYAGGPGSGKPAWAVAWALVAVPGLAVLAAAVARGQVTGLPAFYAAAAQAMGLAGLTALVIGLVLATRLERFERLLGGMRQSYRAQVTFSAVALSGALAYAGLRAVARYPDGMLAMARAIVPWAGSAGALLGGLGLAALVVAVVFGLYGRRGYRVWLDAPRWFAPGFVLVAAYVLVTARAGAPGLIAGYACGLIGVGALALVYRAFAPDALVRRFIYSIQAAVPKGVGTVEVTLAPLGRQLRFEPGQFVFVSFQADGLSPEWHPFTVSSAPASSGVTLDVKSLGAYTETLTRLLPHMTGLTVKVEGAYGGFSYHNFHNPNQVWIAGGIGIAPFLSMAQSLGSEPYNIDLYYSVSTQSELIDLDTLAAAQSARPGQTFRVFPFMADSYSAFVSADIVAYNTGNLEAHDFLVCAPQPMAGTIVSQLLRRGVPRRHIHAELFSLD